MDRSTLLQAFDRDRAGFLAACAAAPPDAPVPGCPGWSVDDLARHMADVCHRWDVRVRARPADPGQIAALPIEQGRAVDEARRQLDALRDALAATSDDDEVWTWTTDHTAGFVVRRIAHETAVHRSDAEAASGQAPEIEASLASDGIDEFLTWFLAPAPDAPPMEGSVHLHCTDVAGEWTIRFVEGAPVVAREHAKGDCAIRGRASDLLLGLWKRRPLTALDVVGDASVAARFDAWTAAR